MFELKLLESAEADDTPRAAQERLVRWCFRVAVYFAIWLTFGSLGAQAAPTQGHDHRIRVFTSFVPTSWHLWCDSSTGRCGAHRNLDR